MNGSVFRDAVLASAIGLAACAAAPPTDAEIAGLYRDYFDALKAANAQPPAPPEQRESLIQRQISAARGLQRSAKQDVRSTGYELEAQADAQIGRNAEALAVLDRFDPASLPAGLQAEYAYVRGCVGFAIAPEAAGRDLDHAVELAPNAETRLHFERMRRICRHEATAEDGRVGGSVQLTP